MVDFQGNCKNVCLAKNLLSNIMQPMNYFAQFHLSHSEETFLEQLKW